MTKKKTYDNDSISSLKGADRVRKRPGVIFGSDGLEGCEHAMFEILSNAIDEARAGYGRLITVTRFADLSIQVEDQGRGCPVDWNEKEGRYNWELVFCELYAGGKYDNENSDNYEYSLGLNGLGSCATQYASRYMDVTVCRDGKEYRLHFERGEIAGEMRVTELKRRHTGSTIRWLPDLEVFTDIDIPADYYREVLRRQAVVNAGVTFRLRCEVAPGKFETEDFLYEHGIRDYLAELETVEASKITLLSNPVEPERKAPELWCAMTELMERGDDILVYTPYVILSDEMREDLAAVAAHSSSFTLVLNDVTSGANPFGCVDYLNQKEEILATGVTLGEYLGDQSLHTKNVLIDDRLCLVGSFNFDMRSAYSDTEVMLAVKSEPLNDRMEAYMLDMRALALPVEADGGYAEGEAAELKTPLLKNLLIVTASPLISLVRFLV